VRALPFLDAATLVSVVPLLHAVDALEAALRGGLDPSAALARSAVPTAAGELLLMPAESASAVGFKLLSLAPGNPSVGVPRIQGLYVLFDAKTLTPQVLIDGSALTSLRTPAVSTLAVQHLAAPEARSLTVFGTGPQALAHVRAIASIRPITQLRIVSRRPGGADALCDVLRGEGLAAEPGIPESVREADIVVCATTSAVPVFDGDMLADGACVIAIGSHQSDVRELDDRVFARAARVVVEDRATALTQAGDVIMAVAAGALVPGGLIDLVETLSLPKVPGISVFKSVGMGWQDLVVAEAAYAAWRGPVPA
jgi:ornithine cyclodeaminase/alanine dehydrogenase-like protein (mu-crystallin family)